VHAQALGLRCVIKSVHLLFNFHPLQVATPAPTPVSHFSAKVPWLPRNMNYCYLLLLLLLCTHLCSFCAFVAQFSSLAGTFTCTYPHSCKSLYCSINIPACLSFARALRMPFFSLKTFTPVLLQPHSFLLEFGSGAGQVGCGGTKMVEVSLVICALLFQYM
jgi:hypothetical protein